VYIPKINPVTSQRPRERFFFIEYTHPMQFNHLQESAGNSTAEIRRSEVGGRKCPDLKGEQMKHYLHLSKP
jgi:hypothetical protein